MILTKRGTDVMSVESTCAWRLINFLQYAIITWNAR